MAKLGGNQIAALTKEQVSQGLDEAKIAAFTASRMRYFVPTQISVMTKEEVNAMSLDTMKTLYDPHLRALTVTQLSNLSEDKIGWLFSKKLEITGFTEAQKNAIVARKTDLENGPP